MASKALKFDLNAWSEGAAEQFRGLDPKEPGQWPLLPKLVAFLFAGVVVAVLGWVFVLSDEQAALDAERGREPTLKDDFRNKLAQAVNLPELRKQKSQV